MIYVVLALVVGFILGAVEGRAVAAKAEHVTEEIDAIRKHLVAKMDDLEAAIKGRL